jgi:hypothetical protein
MDTGRIRTLIGRLSHVSYMVEATWRLLAAARPGGRSNGTMGGRALKEGDVAVGKRTAAALSGWIVFEDEADRR